MTRRPTRLAGLVLAVAISMGGASFAGATTHRPHSSSHPPGSAASVTFPTGLPDANEPSGVAPPSSTALPGFVERYVTDFTGSSLPAGWSVFSGTASGDPGSQWAATHVSVSGGLLSLNAWRDPSYGGQWVTGGLCQCDVASTYGAYFVRSRETGPGPTVVELLWPVTGWPPEIDFNETDGRTTFSFATLHWGAANHQVQVRTPVDLTQWHTWGVVWTPTTVVYTVDGRVWGVVNAPSEVPHVPMSLHLQQQTWCLQGYACPTSDQSTQVDWVASYAMSPSSTSLAPFVSGRVALSAAQKASVASEALAIAAQGDELVSVVGHPTSPDGVALAGRRASAVRSYLLYRLARLHDRQVIVAAVTGSVVSSRSRLAGTTSVSIDVA